MTLDFYIPKKNGRGWWKIYSIPCRSTNKRFNLHRFFRLFARKIEYSFDEFGIRKPMWEKWIEVENEMVKRRFGNL